MTTRTLTDRQRFFKSTIALWTFATACCVVGSAMIAYAVKILHDADGPKRG